MTEITNVRQKNICKCCKNLEEWMTLPDNVYIGRHGRIFIGSVKNNDRKIYHYKGFIWLNPYPVKTYGLDASILMYETYIREKIETEPDKYDLLSLKWKTLGCWCKPNKCHGDILIKLLDELYPTV